MAGSFSHRPRSRRNWCSQLIVRSTTQRNFPRPLPWPVFRRATTGHLAEILGKGYLPMDIQTRRDFYSPSEVAAMVSRLPVDIQQRYESYLEMAK